MNFFHVNTFDSRFKETHFDSLIKKSLKFRFDIMKNFDRREIFLILRLDCILNKSDFVLVISYSKHWILMPFPFKTIFQFYVKSTLKGLSVENKDY